MTEREQQIEAIRKELRCTRAYAVATLNAQEAAKNRQEATIEANERLLTHQSEEAQGRNQE